MVKQAEQTSLPTTKKAQEELERKLFHLRTLYDLSKELFGIIDSERILSKFLMMTTGNFGVIEGFIATHDISSKKIIHLVSVGFRQEEQTYLSKGGSQFLFNWDKEEAVFDGQKLKDLGPFPQTVACVLPFTLDGAFLGILGLGSKIVGEPYSEEDKELLMTLINNLVVALRNARAFEDIKRLGVEMKQKNVQLEETLDDLDRRAYHLKTLFDLSKDIFSSVDFAVILKNFLLMTMGNFGVMEGFLLTIHIPSGEIAHFRSNGYTELGLTNLRESARQFLLGLYSGTGIESVEVLTETIPKVVCGVPFRVDKGCAGFLALGGKLVGEPYNEDDKELLVTLVNDLVISLKNAISFENIKRLNLELQEKNRELEKTLEELRAALKKIEILESIKANLAKFAPTTVTRLIETSPTGDVLEARERDVSVLFLDIEGYTRLTEKIGPTEINRLIEKYFSAFMESIYENNGDVTETSGDGLMVLYLNEDEKTNALEAVRTALTIKEKAKQINQEDETLSEPLLINMGICSGHALVGATKLDTYTGSRWTYSSHGVPTNLAARICGQARGGAVLVSKETADRVKEQFNVRSLGKFTLKNVSVEVEIFAV